MIEERSSLHHLVCASAVAIALLYSGCATTPVAVKSEVLNPPEAAKRSVAVIADPYMDDPVLANKLVDLVRKEMSQRGFRLSPSENQAELVVIPHLVASDTASLERPAKPANPVPRINLINTNIGEPGMMQTGGGFDELPPVETTQPAVPQDQAELQILAVQQDVWHRALNIDQLRIPQVWRISVQVPTYFTPKGKELTAEMVEAAGPRFAQIAKQ
jgi:hypothetical protein